MKPINGWNEIIVSNGGAIKPLTTGGHIVKIRAAKEDADYTGTAMFAIAFDVSEGSEFDNYFTKKYENAKQYGNARYGGTYRVYTLTQDGAGNPAFKRLITAIEDSNSGYSWNWDERTLAGKMVGLVFREREFVDRNGHVRTTVEPCFAASVQRVKDGIEVPAKKTLNNVPQQTETPAYGGYIEVTDEDLPF